MEIAVQPQRHQGCLEYLSKRYFKVIRHILVHKDLRSSFALQQDVADLVPHYSGA